MRNKKINLYKYKENYAILIIQSIKYGNVEFLIDTEDVEYISKYHWCLNIRKYKDKIVKIYAINSKNKQLLHRYILNHNSKLEIDHMNRNTLDNRKSNLKISTHPENMQNRKSHSNNSTGIDNVHYDTNRNKYVGQVRKDNKSYSKRFLNIEDAQAYVMQVRKYLYP